MQHASQRMCVPELAACSVLLPAMLQCSVKGGQLCGSTSPWFAKYETASACVMVLPCNIGVLTCLHQVTRCWQRALTSMDALAIKEVRLPCASGSPKNVTSAMTVLCPTEMCSRALLATSPGWNLRHKVVSQCRPPRLDRCMHALTLRHALLDFIVGNAQTCSSAPASTPAHEQPAGPKYMGHLIFSTAAMAPVKVGTLPGVQARPRSKSAASNLVTQMPALSPCTGAE